MKRFFAINFSVIFFVMSYSCQKRITGNVEVTGRILNSFTKEPETNVQITLYADDATSAKDQTRASISLASIKTGTDGTFRLKSKPSRRNNYYIEIAGVPEKQEIPLHKNSSYDVGDIFVGTKTIYCRANFISRSDSSLKVQYETFQPGYLEFEKGTNTSILLKQEVDGKGFYGGTSFRIIYITSAYYVPHYSTQHYKSLPIISLNDTLNTTIYY